MRVHVMTLDLVAGVERVHVRLQEQFGVHINVRFLPLLFPDLSGASSISASLEDFEEGKGHLGDVWCENVQEEREAEGLSNLRIPLRVEVFKLPVENWQDAEEESLRTVLIRFCEIEVDDEDDTTDVDELENGQFYKLSHRLIINCVVFLNCDTQGEYSRGNDVDNDDDKGSENDCRLLGSIVEKPLFAVQGVVRRILFQGLIVSLELCEFDISDRGSIFHQVAEAETVHKTESIFRWQLLIGPSFTFEKFICRF